MPLEGVLRSRVTSFLEPWLREQPDVEIKLGFRRSHGTWRELEFDPSKLDPFITGSTALAFKRVRVAQLSVQFNPWSWPNLRVTITGFQVILVPRELDEEGERRMGYSNAESKDGVTVDTIDPEGAFLREALENALKTASSGRWLKTSLTEALLTRCQFQFNDISWQVQFSGESKSCRLRSREISLQPRSLNETSLPKGSSGLLFASRKKRFSLSCNCGSLELAINENDLEKILLTLKDPFVSIHFRKLKAMRFDIILRSIDSFFSPLDLPVFFLLLNLFSEHAKSSRNGKELWKIAAQRVSRLSKHPRVLWREVVQVVLLWSTYVHDYEMLLSLVGYPDENALENCVSRICRDLKFSQCIHHQLKVVDELEKQLPTELVGRARWIASNRVHQNLKSNISESAGPRTTFKGNIFIYLKFIWNFMYFLFHSVAVVTAFLLNVFKMHQRTYTNDSSHSRLYSKLSDSYRCVYLTVGDFSLSLLPVATENASLVRDITLTRLPSICLFVKSFFLGHVKNGTENDIFMALGGIRVLFFPSLNVPTMENELELGRTFFRTSQAESRSGSRDILWSEPAYLLHDAVAPANEFHVMIMERSLREIKLRCKMFDEEVEGNKMEHPFFLFELQKKFISLNSDGVLNGILRCIATLGKLNIDLDLESITLAAHLLRQILDSFHWIAAVGEPCSAPNSLNADEDQKEKSEGELHLFASTLNMSLLKLMPMKHIQVGVMLSGCNIKISFCGLREQSPPNSWSSFSTEINGIELSIWPASIAKLLEIYPGLALPASCGDFIWLKEPHLLVISENGLNESLTVEGRISHNVCMSLNAAAASFENLEDNRKSQAIEPISLNIIASTSRQYHHSFYSSQNACTLSLSGVTRKTDMFLYMDELRTLFQVFEEIISARSKFSVDFNFSVMSSSRAYLRRLLSVTNDSMRGQMATLSKDKILPLTGMQFMVDACIELGSFNLILNRSRKNCFNANRPGGASSSSRLSDGQYLPNLPSANWGIFIPKSLIQISCEERNVELLMSFSDIRSYLYTPKYDLDVFNDALMKKHFLQHSRPLGEFYLPYIILKLSIGLDQDSPSSSFSVPHSVFHLLAEIKLGKWTMVSWSMKNPLIDHQCSGLRLLISVTEEFHEIQFESQGGCFLLEMQKLALFIETTLEYSLCLKKLQTWAEGSLAKSHRHDEILMVSGQEYSVALHPTSSSESVRWWFFKFLDVNVSKFSLMFVNEDKFGGVRYLTMETSLHLRFSSIDEKFSFEISNFTLFSVYFPENSRSHDTRISCGLPIDIRDCSTSSADITESLNPISEREVSLQGGPSSSPVYNPSYILKKLFASIAVEKATLDGNLSSLYFASNWLGSGSVSGFNLTISLSEIQMLLDLMVPLSKISCTKSEKISKQEFGSQNQGLAKDTKFKIPEGAIVAIKDLHQHLYIATEDVRGSHRVVGTLHYSLLGERALFRVNWHKGRPLLFSLTSLHAKDVNGEPLCLNFCPGSGFVEVSKKGRGSALWKLVPYNAENYGDDNVLEFSSYGISSGKAFNLINYKNNSGIAFVDGVPEFVKKHGNPFKVKIFHGFNLAYNAMERSIPTSHTGESNESNNNETIYREHGSLLHMSVKIERVSVTIFHEISDASDKFPLVRGCIDDVHIIGQILPSKFRLMGTCLVGMDYFDALMNFWRQMIPPIESCMFVHFRHHAEDSEHYLEGSPAHYYFRIKQVFISLTELSLDILLFIFGTLGITGSYMLRNSIFRNCCKIENLSSSNLICHFADDQDIVLGGEKTASVFLRHVQSTDQHGQTRSSVSVCAFKYGVFSTLPLGISLLDERVFAWRTRISSQKDSSFPGPTLVVKTSMKIEDGLSLSVSPLSRIHNRTGLSLILRLRPQENGPDIIIPLDTGDSLDNSKLLNGSDYSGDAEKAMLSLNEGNFMLFLKPDVSGITKNTWKEVSVDWSENMMSQKSVFLSGLFDKLSERFKEAFGVPSVKSSLTTICCPLTAKGLCFSHMHFLIQITGRDCPVIESPSEGDLSGSENLMVLPQKEIFISPTVLVSNLLQTEILVVLAEKYTDASLKDLGGIGKHEIISHGSNAYFYANPLSLYFTVTLTEWNSKSKPVDTSACVKKLHKQKTAAHFFDIELDFNSGKQTAYLRLSWGDRGILEATVFSSFTLQNNTELSLFCFALSQKPLTMEKNERYSSIFPPELGLFFPPNSTSSWLLKSNRVYIRLKEGKSSESILDLDTLSGFTELRFEISDEAGASSIARVGVSLKALDSKNFLPAQLVTIAPRYVISNESMVPILFRQCDQENDSNGIKQVETKSKAALYVHPGTKKSTTTFFDSLFRKHRLNDEDSLIFIQFGLNEGGYTWSGPICISSLGRFFVKFKKEPVMDSGSGSDTTLPNKSREVQFASIHVVDESSSLVLYFYMPPDLDPPYRIENGLHEASITFYQKDTGDPDTLGAGDSVDYVWDDQNKPHKLLAQISGMQILREINIDKIGPWKSFYKARQSKLLSLHFQANRMSRFQNKDYDESKGLVFQRLGYEVYVDGLTRVLRICEVAESSKEDAILQPYANFHFRMGSFTINFLEDGIQGQAKTPPQALIAVRLMNLALYSLSTHANTYFCAKIEAIKVENKWQGAPFASMIRRSQLHDTLFNEDMLHFVFILHSGNPNLKEIKHLSLLLQPFDLNLDEETLMRLAAFWRTSLSDSKTQSQLYYFKQFEIHPLKIRTCFLPGNPYSSYSSAQETLRSLLHTVIKVPTVKNTIIELNGVLLNHALLTKKELIVKCFQHYSWYIVRAVYIAKGSPLLPPAFASIFDDAASSSLDVFFDPSTGSIDLPGFTLGMFKFVNRYINSKGFSGTKRYLGDLRITMKKAGSSVLFAAITEISDSILRGAEADGFNGLMNGFHQGVLRLAMEPSLLGAAVMHGGPDRKIVLDQSPGADELYIEGYLQAMLHVTYNQEYLQVKVIDNLVHLKNLPPNSALIDEIMDNVKSFLFSQGLLKGDDSNSRRSLRHLRGEREWSVGPMLLTLGEHLFVSFAIRLLRARADELLGGLRARRKTPTMPLPLGQRPARIWAVGGFVLSGVFAYVDGWLCRRIPNPVVRRIVSGFLLTFLEKKDKS